MHRAGNGGDYSECYAENKFRRLHFMTGVYDFAENALQTNHKARPRGNQLMIENNVVFPPSRKYRGGLLLKILPTVWRAKTSVGILPFP